MAKKQSSKWVATRSGFGSQPLSKNLKQAEALIRRGELQSALDILEAANRQSPDQFDVLKLLVEIYFQLADYYHYFLVSERLHQLKPQNPELAFSYAGAAMLANNPFVALRIFREAQSQWPDHGSLLSAQENGMISSLEKFIQEFQDMHGLDPALLMEVGSLNDRLQMFIFSAAYEEAVKVGEELVQLKPDFIPGWNNLSLAQFMLGEVDTAIATAEAMLERDPDNIHALANRMRYYWLSGRLAEAKAMAPRLKAIAPQTLDSCLQQAEIFSYLGDDQAVWDVYQQAETIAAAKDDQASPMLYHLAAVAIARLGNREKARLLWEQALDREPDFQLAKENLMDQYLPIGSQEGPWPFHFHYWTNRKLFDSFDKITEQLKQTPVTDDSQDLLQQQQMINAVLTENPELEILLPILWERGDPPTRELIKSIVKDSTKPEIQALTKQFALSQWGTDLMRMELARMAKQAGLIPEPSVQLWVKGKLAEVELLTYEVHDEPIAINSPKVVDLLERALIATYERKYREAEKSLRKAMELEPQANNIRYNLGANLIVTGREEEGKALVHQVHADDPTYLFAAMTIAGDYILQRELDKAEELIKPFKSRERFHTSEFDSFCATNVELEIARREFNKAEQWLMLWETVLPNSQNLQKLKLKLNQAQQSPLLPD